jgi:CBS-domain-containing membrane protein
MARHRPETSDRKSWIMIGAGAVGGGVAIAIMEFLSAQLTYPLASIPFATSIVLVMGSPEAKPAQPRALVGGHLVSALAGLMVVKAVGSGPFAAASAVCLAMAAMHLTRTFHPPAGINPLLIGLGDLPWTFLLVPVAAGALLLLAFAYVWHNGTRRGSWPQETWSEAFRMSPLPPPAGGAAIRQVPASGAADGTPTMSSDGRSK